MSDDNGMGFLDVLLMIFITLKLTDNVDWSWFAVLSPVWIYIVLCFLVKERK